MCSFLSTVIKLRFCMLWHVLKKIQSIAIYPPAYIKARSSSAILGRILYHSLTTLLECLTGLFCEILRAPLISKQLCINDYNPLTDKIVSRISSWTSLLLSMTGSAQLLRAVIFAIQSFWSKHFILPNVVHKKLKFIFTRFLWKGNVNVKGGSKLF